MPINSFLYPGAKVTTAYEVANSCRFNDGDSAYMTRANAGSDGTTDTWTMSMWVKRGVLGSTQYLFQGYTSGNFNVSLRFTSDDQLYFFQEDHPAQNGRLLMTTERKFRDCSSWYHILAQYDSTQSTNTDRAKIYINGVQETTFNGSVTWPDQNFDSEMTSASTNIHIAKENGGDYFDGYMAEVVLLDGTAATPTSFGEYDEDSPTIWKPKDVSGLSFGTHGFYLDFEDSSNLGNDANGGTDFTESGLATTDQSSDSPTNNFATWNPLFRKGTTTPAFAEGSLKSTFDDGGANEFALTTFGVSAGKWYAEVKWTSATGTGATATGILDMAYTGTDDPNNSVTNAFGYFGSGQKNVSGTASSYGDSYTTNDIIGIAIDMDNNKLYFSKNGTFQDSGDPTSGSTGTGAISIISGVTYGIFTSDYNNKVAELNTGSPAYSISSGNADGNSYGNFEYSVPSGYLALCTKNLGSDGG